MIFIVILSLVLLSAKSYQFASSTSDQNNNKRAVLSYIVNCIRDSGNGEVLIEERSGRECLIIRSTGEAEIFEQRFYDKDGMLMEEYTQADTELRPEDALAIGEASSLDFDLNENGLLTIRTDEGSSCVRIRKLN